MLEAVAAAAPRGRAHEPKKLLERLRSNGRLDALKEDLPQRRRSTWWRSGEADPVEQAAGA